MGRQSPGPNPLQGLGQQLAQVLPVQLQVQLAVLQPRRLQHLLDQLADLAELGGDHLQDPRRGRVVGLDRPVGEHRDVPLQHGEGPPQLVRGDLQEVGLDFFQLGHPLGVGRQLARPRQLQAEPLRVADREAREVRHPLQHPECRPLEGRPVGAGADHAVELVADADGRPGEGTGIGPEEVGQAGIDLLAAAAVGVPGLDRTQHLFGREGEREVDLPRPDGVLDRLRQRCQAVVFDPDQSRLTVLRFEGPGDGPDDGGLDHVRVERRAQRARGVEKECQLLHPPPDQVVRKLQRPLALHRVGDGQGDLLEQRDILLVEASRLIGVELEHAHHLAGREQRHHDHALHARVRAKCPVDRPHRQVGRVQVANHDRTPFGRGRAHDPLAQRQP